MGVSAIIPGVAAASDDFAAYLQTLRGERRLSAQALAKRIGKNPDFIADWERSTRTVNKAVLHEVCKILDLTEPERYRLFDLAEHRNLPEDAPRLVTPVEQLHTNVHRALSEIDFNLPADIADTPQALFHLGECASWLLTYYALIGPDYGAERFFWPDDIYKHGIVDSSWRKDAKIEFPPELLSKFGPNIEVPEQLTETAARSIGEGMAELLRRWYLSDLDRCRDAARALKRWSLVYSEDVGHIVAFNFADPDIQGINVPPPSIFPSARRLPRSRASPPDPVGLLGVRLPVAEICLRRETTAHVWQELNTRKQIEPLGEYPHRFDHIDSIVYSTYYVANGFLKDRKPVGNTWLQTFRDALYILQSAAWTSIRSTGILLRHIMELHTDDPAFSTAQETIKKLPPLDFYSQLTAYEKFLDVRETISERLGKAEHMMVRELQKNVSNIARAGKGKYVAKVPRAKPKHRTKKKKRNRR